MAEGDEGAEQAARPKRADARRNEAALLDAAAAVFVRSGVEAPVRDIAAEAGVGTATIYRHFPTRADLIIAVYRHQVEACAQASAPRCSGRSLSTPFAALGRWIDMFVGFLVTKHGLAAVLRGPEQRMRLRVAAFLVPRPPGRLALAKAAAGSPVRGGGRGRDQVRHQGVRADARRRQPLRRSARETITATTPGGWPGCSSPDCASPAAEEPSMRIGISGTHGTGKTTPWPRRLPRACRVT